MKKYISGVFIAILSSISLIPFAATSYDSSAQTGLSNQMQTQPQNNVQNQMQAPVVNSQNQTQPAPYSTNQDGQVNLPPPYTGAAVGGQMG